MAVCAGMNYRRDVRRFQRLRRRRPGLDGGLNAIVDRAGKRGLSPTLERLTLMVSAPPAPAANPGPEITKLVLAAPFTMLATLLTLDELKIIQTGVLRA